jgi:hypothetical protein
MSRIRFGVATTGTALLALLVFGCATLAVVFLGMIVLLFIARRVWFKQPLNQS